MKVKIRAGLNNILPGRCFSTTDLVGNKSYYVVIGKKDGSYNYMPSYNVVQVLPHKNGLRYFNISNDLCIWRFFDQTLAKKEAKKLFNAIILSNVPRDFDYRDLHFCKKEVKMNGESYELLNFPFIEPIITHIPLL